MKGENLQTRIFHLARISLRFEGSKVLQTSKSKRCSASQNSFTKNVKGTSLRGKGKATTRNTKIPK